MVLSLWSCADGTLEVVHDPENRFYEIREDGTAAGLLVYERHGDRITLTHTTIHEAFKGHGLVTILLRESLGDLRSAHVPVANRCPVVDRFVERRPEFAAVIGPPPAAVAR
jgi:predicted GNAT family acetyltransferase